MAAAEPKVEETIPEVKEGEKAAGEVNADEKTAAPEKPKEKEEDASSDSRKKVSVPVAFSETDSTINCMSAAGGALLMTLGEGGMQYLLASSRATVGMKSGRYMFEVRVAESCNPAESGNTQGKVPLPKQHVRVGFSLAGSSLCLADTGDSVCFDSDGFFSHGKKRQKAGTKFGVETVAVLLNLDASSPNANTISLFKNGSRASDPQPLPENLRGKALYPTVTYRNVTLAVNFGPEPSFALPFKCRMIGDAAEADVEVAKATTGAQSEVLLPIGLPDNGVFDWIDGFLERNPHFIELSDRKILQWAKQSGLRVPQETGSNDKPNMTFGVPMMDDNSVRNVVASVAPVLNRNFVIGELKANLVPSEREVILHKFSAPHFKKTAVVIMGEPDKQYRDSVHAGLLKEKVAKAEVDKKKKAQEAERKRLLEEKKRLAEEARKAKLAAQRKKEGVEAPEEEKKEEVAEVAPEPAKEDEDVPVELTEEEKNIVHRKHRLPDMSEKMFSKAFMSFALPTKSEGFSEIKYLWQNEEKCAELLKKFKQDNKLTQKVEDLKPSAWFKEQLTAWQKKVVAWKKSGVEWKNPAQKKKILAKKKEERDAKAKEEGKDEAEPMEIDMDDLDVMAVEDVTDVGTGEPLVAKFAYEDWALLTLRYEMFLLLHAFRKDLDDPERQAFPESHLTFYYSKYYSKTLNPNSYACKSIADVLKLIKDTVEVDSNSQMKALLPEETSVDHFVKLCENHRRDRERRCDAGDETAQLKFPSQQPQQRPPQAVGAAVGAKRPAPAGAAAAPAWKQPRTTFAPTPRPGAGAYAPGSYRR
eukprot:TRINITY_DN1511_c0_g1_i1.p1 TRINITY_DN1511_c0_g1~~TRINITY_DN1511_c0_g1_i1.p1  ORF type:complete len:834 (-),score=200.58 TRINITY_DN1511_c0_g1_i1:142-2580(-)